MSRFILILCLSLIIPSLAKAFTSISDYQAIEISGWEILVSPDYRQHAKDRRAALAVLEHQLDEIVEVLPDHALDKLKEVPIWLEYDAPGPYAGIYHISRIWLANNGYNPDKVDSVEMNFNMVRWKDFQPWIVLHELTHAYHRKHVGLDYEPLKSAYEAAKKSGAYDNVLRKDGTRWRAYSMTNHREYFSELTEAYFGANEDEPYDRSMLRQMDPTGYSVIKEVWSKRWPD